VFQKASVFLLAARALTQAQPLPRMNSDAMKERSPLYFPGASAIRPHVDVLERERAFRNPALLPGKII